MDRWLTAFKEIGFELVGRESSNEMWGLAAVCVFVLFFLYGRLSEGFKGGGKSSFMVLLPGLILMAVVMATVRVFLSEDWLWQLLAALIVVVAVILPVTAAVEKASYLSVALVWGVCALALVMIIAMERPLVSSFRHGIEKGSLVKKQNNFFEALDKR